MYRDKSIIRLRKNPTYIRGHYWDIKMGKFHTFRGIGISRLFRLIATLIQDKGKVYSIDIIIKRKR